MTWSASALSLLYRSPARLIRKFDTANVKSPVATSMSPVLSINGPPIARNQVYIMESPSVPRV